MFSSRIIIFVIFFSCIVKECKGGEIRGYAPPSHCNTTDCPKYTVIQSEKEFEIRSYSQALWVTAPSIVHSSIMSGIQRGGNDLIRYFRGNDKNVILAEGGPVAMLEVLNSTYKVYYYVPYKYQNGGLPRPTKPVIMQVKLPVYKYATVRRVNEEVLEDKVLAQVD